MHQVSLRGMAVRAELSRTTLTAVVVRKQGRSCDSDRAAAETARASGALLSGRGKRQSGVGSGVQC
jgi:hypothetical protein